MSNTEVDVVGVEAPKEESQDTWERVANSLTHGFSQRQVADSLGLTEGRISQIVNDEAFKRFRIAITAQVVKQHSEHDGNLDKLEEQAAKNLSIAIKYNRDPALNLQVLKVTNSAVRRSRPTNEIVDPSNSGSRVQLNLTTRIVQKLANGTEHLRETSLQAAATINAEDLAALLITPEADENSPGIPPLADIILE